MSDHDEAQPAEKPDIWSLGPSLDDIWPGAAAPALPPVGGVDQAAMPDPTGEPALPRLPGPATTPPPGPSPTPPPIPGPTPAQPPPVTASGPDRNGELGKLLDPREGQRPLPQQRVRRRPPAKRRKSGTPMWFWAAIGVLLLALAAFIATRVAGGDGSASDATLPQVPEIVPSTPVPEAVVTTAAPVTVLAPVASTVAQTTPAPTTTPAPSTTVAATVPVTTAAPTTVPATTAAPTTIAATTIAPTTVAPTTVVVTTVAPTTVAATPVTTSISPAPASNGPVVNLIAGEGPCKYGSNCLLAGFTIEGFSVRPTRFVCEFGDGTRYTFKFDSGGVVQACATGAAKASITIEVGGVRSQTVTRG